jgi:hypothetical protein
VVPGVRRARRGIRSYTRGASPGLDRKALKLRPRNGIVRGLIQIKAALAFPKQNGFACNDLPLAPL